MNSLILLTYSFFQQLHKKVKELRFLRQWPQACRSLQVTLELAEKFWTMARAAYWCLLRMLALSRTQCYLFLIVLTTHGKWLPVQSKGFEKTMMCRLRLLDISVQSIQGNYIRSNS